ncbi:MAG: ABC transporter ATP-binding protein [Thermoanaerobaculum sp.]
MSPALELNEVVVRRGQFQLGPVSLAVAPGEYLVVLGPSGAGKTVLLETMAGWHPAEEGAVLCQGQPVLEVPPRERRMAYLSQHLPLLPRSSVLENLTFGVRCRGESPDRKLLQHLVAMLGLKGLLERGDVRTLSRGEQQRLALAQALLTRPRILLLDEPSTALDPHRKPELWQLLRTLHREFSCTVVHVTHDRNEAFFLGQRVAVVLAGKLQQLATPQELYHQPASLAVAQFLSPENLWPVAAATPNGSGLRVTLAGVPLTLEVARQGPAAYVGIRPEEVAIIDPHRPLGPQVQHNLFPAAVRDLVFLDGQAQVHMETKEGLSVTARVPLCTALDRGLSVGQELTLCLKPRSLYLLPPPNATSSL